MQLTCLLLLALGATTLATPIDIPDPSFPDFNGTSAFTGHELEKRGTYGWLASYRTSDTSCNQGYAGDRPKISKSCINFVPVEGGNSIGVGLLPSRSLPSLPALLAREKQASLTHRPSRSTGAPGLTSSTPSISTAPRTASTSPKLSKPRTTTTAREPRRAT